MARKALLILDYFTNLYCIKDHGKVIICNHSSILLFLEYLRSLDIKVWSNRIKNITTKKRMSLYSIYSFQGDLKYIMSCKLEIWAYHEDMSLNCWCRFIMSRINVLILTKNEDGKAWSRKSENTLLVLIEMKPEWNKKSKRSMELLKGLGVQIYFPV